MNHLPSPASLPLRPSGRRPGNLAGQSDATLRGRKALVSPFASVAAGVCKRVRQGSSGSPRQGLAAIGSELRLNKQTSGDLRSNPSGVGAHPPQPPPRGHGLQDAGRLWASSASGIRQAGAD